MVCAKQDLNDLCNSLQSQELNSANGLTNTDVYLQLLTVYLVQGDLMNAKFLWKRIPELTKAEAPELLKVWLIDQLL